MERRVMGNYHARCEAGENLEMISKGYLSLYEGTQQQNEATMSRFNTLYFKQPESVIGQFKAATAAALKKSGCDYKLKEEYFKQAQSFYGQCMKAVHKAAVSNAVLNIRGFVRALTIVAESEGFCSLKR